MIAPHFKAQSRVGNSGGSGWEGTVNGADYFRPPVLHTRICGHFVKTEVKEKDEERIERKEEEEMFVVCPNPSLPLLPLFGGSRILKNGNERWKRREEEGMLKGTPPTSFGRSPPKKMEERKGI